MIHNLLKDNMFIMFIVYVILSVISEEILKIDNIIVKIIIFVILLGVNNFMNRLKKSKEK